MPEHCEDIEVLAREQYEDRVDAAAQDAEVDAFEHEVEELLAQLDAEAVEREMIEEGFAQIERQAQQIEAEWVRFEEEQQEEFEARRRKTRGRR